MHNQITVLRVKHFTTIIITTTLFNKEKSFLNQLITPNWRNTNIYDIFQSRHTDIIDNNFKYEIFSLSPWKSTPRDTPYSLSFSLLSKINV